MNYIVYLFKCGGKQKKIIKDLDPAEPITFHDETYDLRIAENEAHRLAAKAAWDKVGWSNLADHSLLTNLAKAGYHYWMGNPSLGGNDEHPFVPLTGTVPFIGGINPAAAGVGVSRAADALKSLGPVVKTVNGVKYYRSASGEIKTGEEIAKEIKAARDARVLKEMQRTNDPQRKAQLRRALNHPEKARRDLSYKDKVTLDYNDAKMRANDKRYAENKPGYTPKKQWGGAFLNNRYK